MKKNFIIILLLLLSGCTFSENKEDYNELYESRYYLEKDEGWIYYISISYDKNGKINLYNFNGINTRLDNIYNLYMPLYENGKLVEKLEARCNCLNYYQTYKKEYDSINYFFMENKFQDLINIDDLDSLELSYYKKEDLVYLFNNAIINRKYRKIGNYNYVLNTLKIDNVDGEWSLVTDGSYGYIELINIEYKYKDGTYLKDKNNKSEEEQNVENNLKNIEKFIAQNQQSKNLDKYFEFLSNDEYKELLIILNKIGEYDI